MVKWLKFGDSNISWGMLVRLLLIVGK